MDAKDAKVLYSEAERANILVVTHYIPHTNFKNTVSGTMKTYWSR